MLALDGAGVHGTALSTLSQERILVQEANLKCTISHVVKYLIILRLFGKEVKVCQHQHLQRTGSRPDYEKQRGECFMYQCCQLIRLYTVSDK